MLDFLGQTLKISDQVIFVKEDELALGTVVHFSVKKVEIRHSNSLMISKVYPKKCCKLHQ